MTTQPAFKIGDLVTTMDTLAYRMSDIAKGQECQISMTPIYAIQINEIGVFYKIGKETWVAESCLVRKEKVLPTISRLASLVLARLATGSITFEPKNGFFPFSCSVNEVAQDKVHGGI